MLGTSGDQFLILCRSIFILHKNKREIEIKRTEDQHHKPVIHEKVLYVLRR